MQKAEIKKILLLIGVLFFLDIKALVHVFGDSHVSSFKNLPGSCLNWFHGRTMYRIGRDGIAGLNIKNYGVQENDVFIFVVGEIDIRCHIGRLSDLLNKSVEDIINELVLNYINTIQLNRMQYTHIRPFIFGVLPPTNDCFNNSLPFYGSLLERVENTKKLNQVLKFHCNRNDIGFINVYDFYAGEDGSLNRQYSDQCVHIASPHNKYVLDSFLSLCPEASQWNKDIQLFHDRG